MALYFIGIGLNDEKDITVKGLEAVKKSRLVYIESYTSILHVPISKLEEFYGKKIIPANREAVERRAYEILDSAAKEDVAFLVIGDIFGATTHTDLMIRAKEKNIECRFIFNASILNAVGIVGLELYKYGKTTSIPFETDSFKPETHYEVLKLNKSMGLHTLILLDLKPAENRFLTVNDAIRSLLDIESNKKQEVFNDETMCVGCARIGGDYKIRYGMAKDLLDEDFGKPLHCLIIPGNLHFMEEDALKQWM